MSCYTSMYWVRTHRGHLGHEDVSRLGGDTSLRQHVVASSDNGQTLSQLGCALVCGSSWGPIWGLLSLILISCGHVGPLFDWLTKHGFLDRTVHALSPCCHCFNHWPQLETCYNSSTFQCSLTLDVHRWNHRTWPPLQLEAMSLTDSEPN